MAMVMATMLLATAVMAAGMGEGATMVAAAKAMKAMVMRTLMEEGRAMDTKAMEVTMAMPLRPVSREWCHEVHGHHWSGS
mmetsp:Transcript_26002/g.35097  ORF Transcript_26002/g.35097 Transcript_26002/m.35097 type:complete len:80 (+) Transcript_26002:251-490(+)